MCGSDCIHASIQGALFWVLSIVHLYPPPAGPVPSYDVVLRSAQITQAEQFARLVGAVQELSREGKGFFEQTLFFAGYV